MSEHFPASIEIGGPLDRAHLLELTSAADEDGAGLGWGEETTPDMDDVETVADKKQTLVLVNDQASDGYLDALVAFCRRYGLAFRHHRDAKFEFEAVLQVSLDGGPVSRLPSDNEGHALADLDKVKLFLQQGKTLQELHDWLMLMEGPLPPLELYGKPPEEEDEEDEDGGVDPEYAI